MYPPLRYPSFSWHIPRPSLLDHSTFSTENHGYSVLLTSSATPTCPGYAYDYIFNIYMYDSPLSSLSIDHIYVAFCAYVSPQVFFRSYAMPTLVLLYCPVRTGNIAYLMSRILFRLHLLPRAAAIRRTPILLHEKACTTLPTYQDYHCHIAFCP